MSRCRRLGCRQTVLSWLHPHYCSLTCRDHAHHGTPVDPPPGPLLPPPPRLAATPPPAEPTGWLTRALAALAQDPR